MAGKGKGRGEGSTIVIKREEEGGHAHHGGAWKVAYADFVTAMMAFFLLMWLLNATTEEQRRGLADYFAPTNVLGRSQTGTGQPFGGRTVNSAGAMASDSGAIRVERGPAPIRTDLEDEETEVASSATAGDPQSRQSPPMRATTGGGLAVVQSRLETRPVGRMVPGAAQTGQLREAEQGQAPAQPQTRPREAAPPRPATPEEAAATLARQQEATLRAELARREQAAFEQTAEDLRGAVRNDPQLAELANQLRVEQTAEGLRIQILDAERQAMFPLAGSQPNDRARALLQKVAQAVARLPNGIAITGHTDSTPFRGGERTNWDLSADRANAVRRLLTEAGVAEQRMRTVSGHADREPLLPEEPMAAGNRRVAITLLRQAPATPANP